MGVLVIALFTAVAVWLRVGRDTGTQDWTGIRLGGPEIALGPRASPDGKTVAFTAIVDGNTQVAVMNPDSGHWTVLTHDRGAGRVQSVNWSRDGSKIYFDRWAEGPLGLFSIPALGGEPRLVLPDAGDGAQLRDGSLLFVRFNSDRDLRLHRFWPESGRLQALDAVLCCMGSVHPFRSFPDGERLVFWGKPAQTTKLAQLYILDLKTNTSRPIGPEAGTDFMLGSLGGINPLDDSILASLYAGDLNQIVAIPSDGKGPIRVVLTVTDEIWDTDMASDGSLYASQVARPIEVLRFNETAQTPEMITEVFAGAAPVLELPGERFLLPSFNGRRRLLLAKATGERVPFVDTDEETGGPVAFVGSDRIAFVLGRQPNESIGIVSLQDGRLLQRWKFTSPDGVKSLAASPDGTIFYVQSGSLWSISASQEARKLGPADAVAFDPLNQNLVVQINETAGARLVRMPISGGSPVPISIHGNVPIPINTRLGANAVRADGKILLSVASRDSFFYGAGVLDPLSGSLRKLPIRYEGDLFGLSWNHKNEIVTAGYLLRSAIWRFQMKPQRNIE